MNKQLARPLDGNAENSGIRSLAIRLLLVVTSVLYLILSDHATGFSMVNSTAPTCSNSVAGGVYWDANGDGAHERSEPFLAGVIQVINSAHDTTNLIQSADGFFVLDDLACDEYAVYHDDAYVGKFVISRVMGQVLIELPKTNQKERIFIPLVMR